MALTGACTSAPTEPVDDRPPAPTIPSTAPTATTDPGAEPTSETVRVSGERVLLRPPPGGSFRVRGRYPWQPSRCVDPDRPTLEGRYPGVLGIRVVEDGSLTVAVTLDFQSYLEGIAEAYAAMDERRAIKSLVRVGTP